VCGLSDSESVDHTITSKITKVDFLGSPEDPRVPGPGNRITLEVHCCINCCAFCFQSPQTRFVVLPRLPWNCSSPNSSLECLPFLESSWLWSQTHFDTSICTMRKQIFCFTFALQSCDCFTMKPQISHQLQQRVTRCRTSLALTANTFFMVR